MYQNVLLFANCIISDAKSFKLDGMDGMLQPSKPKARTMFPESILQSHYLGVKPGSQLYHEVRKCFYRKYSYIESTWDFSPVFNCWFSLTSPGKTRFPKNICTLKFPQKGSICRVQGVMETKGNVVSDYHPMLFII